MRVDSRLALCSSSHPSFSQNNANANYCFSLATRHGSVAGAEFFTWPTSSLHSSTRLEAESVCNANVKLTPHHRWYDGAMQRYSFTSIGWAIVRFAHVVFSRWVNRWRFSVPRLHRWFLRFDLHCQFVELLATNPARGCTTSLNPTGRGKEERLLAWAGVCLAVECVEVELA